MDTRLLIDGRLEDGAARLAVVNPATGRAFTTAPRADAAQAERAITAAKRAFPAWAALGYAQRRAHIEAFADAVAARSEEMVMLLNRERGGPLEQIRGEVAVTIAALRHFAAQELHPETLRQNEAERIVAQRYAQGVVAAITPWNRPITLLAFKLGPALITGNTVIAKPAPTTPLSTLLMGEAAVDTLPAGVFQTLVDDNDLGSLLTSHPDVAHVSFTGSTATGKKVLASASATLKRFTLELGGNDVAIVLDDADIDTVAPKIFAAAMINAGQVCYATKRLYVPTSMAAAMGEALAKLAREAKVGDGLEPGTLIGPVQNRMQYDKVLGFIQSARQEGGRFLAGGNPIPGDGYFIEPTIVAGLSEQARLVREEQFGPVLPILTYDNIDEVVARANDSPYGLGGSIWTADPARGFQVASRIESGTVWVNQHMALPFDVPFGGAKESGLGLQNGIQGMEDFTQLRIVNARLV